MAKTNKQYKKSLKMKRPKNQKKSKNPKNAKKPKKTNKKMSNKNKSMVGLAPPARRVTRRNDDGEEEAIRNMVDTMTRNERYRGSLTDESFREIAIFVRKNSEFLFMQMQTGNPQITIMDIIEGTIDYKNDKMGEGMNELDVVKRGLTFAEDAIEMIKNQQNQPK